MNNVKTIIHGVLMVAIINEYIKEVQADPSDISTYLKKVTGSLNAHGKEMIIKGALDVAYSDGHFDESERKLILEMGQVMELSSAHIKGIMAEYIEKQD